MTPQETDPDMPWVSRSLVEVWSGWPASGSEPLNAAVGARGLLKGVAVMFTGSTIVWPQVKQQGGTTALPINKTQVPPPVSLYHREPSISLLPFSIRGKTDWKPQSQKNSQTDYMDSSMKLWAMQCRATQDGQVMAESSDKMWSTGVGNGKPLQYSCLENPMNSMKRPLIRISLNQ